MIRKLSTPTIKLQISAKTVVKITLVAMATKYAVDTINHAVTPYIRPYADRAIDAMNRRADKLEKLNKDDEEAAKVEN